MIQKNINSQQNTEIHIDIKDLLRVFIANKKIFIISVLCCLFLAFLYLLILPSKYTSSALIQVENNNASNLVGFEKIFSPMGTQQASPSEVQSVLIKSRFILLPTVETLGLDLQIHPDYFPLLGKLYAKHHSKQLAKPLLGMSRFAWGGEKLVFNRFYLSLQQGQPRFTLVAQNNGRYDVFDDKQHLVLQGIVGQDEKVRFNDQGVLEINVEELVASPGTHFIIKKLPTEQIINGLAKQLQITDLKETGGPINEYGKTGVLGLSYTSEDPKFVVDLLDTIVKIAQEKDIEKKSAEATKTLDFLNQQLPVIKNDLNQAEFKLNDYQAKTGTINLAEASRLLLGQMADTQKQLESLQVTRSAALQKFTPQHPYILALNERIKGLQDAFKKLQVQASQLPANDQPAISLMRDVKVKNALYLTLLEKIQSLKVAQASTVSDIRILDFAPYPAIANSKHAMLILLASILGGVFLGGVIILIMYSLNRKIVDPTVMEQQFGLATMAIVPHSNQQEKIIKEIDPKQETLPLLAKIAPKDLSIEALRSFRTSLKFAMLEAKSNIIMLTGISPGVGKSFISVNFAYLLADAGNKVLLIDGDIRKGHLRNYFQPNIKLGLSSIISGDCTFEEALLKDADNTNLNFIASGDYPPNPSELLMNERFNELLTKASKLYDYIVIDTAPILAVTDAAIISQYAGASFLVFGSGMHEATEVEIALKRFTTNGVKLNGVIFNFNRIKTGLYNYNYTYNYNYQYE